MGSGVWGAAIGVWGAGEQGSRGAEERRRIIINYQLSIINYHGFFRKGSDRRHQARQTLKLNSQTVFTRGNFYDFGAHNR